MIALMLLLSGCASSGQANLLKGELFVSEHQLQNRKQLKHEIKLNEDEIYMFRIYFR